MSIKEIRKLKGLQNLIDDELIKLIRWVKNNKLAGIKLTCIRVTTTHEKGLFHMITIHNEMEYREWKKEKSKFRPPLMDSNYYVLSDCQYSVDKIETEDINKAIDYIESKI